jgi:hypothetical protein
LTLIAPEDGRAAQDAARSANGRFRLVALGAVWGRNERVLPFLCECADDACNGRIDMGIGDYFAAHEASGRYIVLRGHAVIAHEAVIGDRGAFLVMGKPSA